MEIIFPLIDGDKFNYYKMAFGLVYWVLFGFGSGYIMKKLAVPVNKKSQNETGPTT
jgi:hypothetical protein